MVFSGWGQAIRQFLDDEKFRQNHRIRTWIYVGLGLAMFAILVGSILPPRYHFTVGQTSPTTIVSPTTTVDTAATEAEKEAAESKVPKQYAQSPAVLTQAVNRVDILYAAAMQAASDSSLSDADKLKNVRSAAPAGVSQATLVRLLTRTPAQMTVLERDTERVVEEILDAPFYQESMQQATLLVDRQILNLNLGLDHDDALIVQNVAVSVLKPNMIYQAQATAAARQQAALSVQPVLIHAGDIIVAKNGIVTQDVISKLRDVGLYSSYPSVGIAIGFALFVALSVGMLAAYIERRAPRRRVDNLLLGILGLVFVLMSILISVTKWIIVAGGPNSIAYLLPISLGAMLITVMMDSSLAVVASFYFSFLLGAALNFNYDFVFYGFVGSLVGAYSVARVTSRGTFMRAGFFVSLMNIGSVLALYLLQANRSADLHSLSLHVGLAALNGIFAAILAMGILPFFESAFGLLTPIRLLELSNPNHPLLRKVLLEAPGTYHHSLIVGNLAEAAAELVGADPLLCRVGAYYHDVGKTKRPMFFVENQMTKDNPHEKVAPSLSHLIITSHVSDGLEMLKQAGLPKPIQDICATHHGTTILWYFFNKAKEQDKNGTVKVDDFRYPGPKPKTRECAIIMICDAVEAAVRSMARPTPNRVEGVIRKIIRDRLQDGQLDECDLTLQDLDAMVGAFMKTLKGIYHSRIEYPDIDKLRKEVAK
ncbi:HD family phosphohydrolase [Alicyclobacillus hesperidum subsp. aegles]|uniref:HD family phosphohydrolase n=1 Tax=Alicyclobacillus hesperidum TaxID=89784 RepID=UPI00071907E8|nr:HDIG domain-containing metalloprotein [Alicyclobacillus hesperidum]KRW91707.1 7TM receptor with intracellular metal dependent phosphohydrolase [Alicyclobacillus tengchongensis]GLG00300.1 HD family phosphohydrolase [Alicyclobacillus hesperidum subsp. aegles]